LPLLPFNDRAFCLGQTIKTSHDRVNFGFVGGDGLPLGSEALLDKGFDTGFVCGLGERNG